MMSWTNGLTEDKINTLLSFDPVWQQVFANPASTEASNLDLPNHHAGIHAPETLTRNPLNSAGMPGESGQCRRTICTQLRVASTAF